MSTLNTRLRRCAQVMDARRSDQQDWPEPYPDAQIAALLDVLAWLHDESTNLASIAGHDALDLEPIPAADDPERKVRRKTEPGPGFPSDRVVAANSRMKHPKAR